MVYYMVRHKATGKIMPQMRRGRGYSHWNPGNPDNQVTAETDVPRLLKDEKQARGVIRAWIAFPNGHLHTSQNHMGEYDDDVVFKPDGRKAEELEVLTVNVEIMPLVTK